MSFRAKSPCHSERSAFVLPGEVPLSFRAECLCRSERSAFVVPSGVLLSFRAKRPCHSERSEGIYFTNRRSIYVEWRFPLCFFETTGKIPPHFYVFCPAFCRRPLTWAHENARIWTFVHLPYHCFPLLESRPCTLLQCTAKSFSITYSLYTAQRKHRNSRNSGSSEHKKRYRWG